MTVDALTLELGELVADATGLPTSVDPVRPPAVPGCFVGPPTITPDTTTGGRVLVAQWEVGTVTPADTGAWSAVATTGEHIVAAIIAHAVLGLVDARSILYTTPDGELPGYRIDVAVLVHATEMAPLEAGVRLVAVATLTAAGTVVPVGINDGAASFTAAASLTAAATVVGIPINDGAAALTADTTLTAAGTVVPVVVNDGAVTLTAAAAMTAAGTVVAASWDPGTLPGLVGWWDPADTSTLTTAGSPAQVSAVANKKAGGPPLLQATSVNQPRSGVDTVNGHNVLTVDATDNMAAAITTTMPWTALVVVKCTGSDFTAPLYGSATDFTLYTIGGSWYAKAGGGGPAGAGAVVAGALEQFVMSQTSTVGNLWRNRAQVLTNAANSGATPWTSFAFQNVVGQVCELVLMAGNITAGDRASWDAYATAKWGTT